MLILFKLLLVVLLLPVAAAIVVSGFMFHYHDNIVFSFKTWGRNAVLFYILMYTISAENIMDTLKLYRISSNLHDANMEIINTIKGKYD